MIASFGRLQLDLTLLQSCLCCGLESASPTSMQVQPMDLTLITNFSNNWTRALALSMICSSSISNLSLDHCISVDRFLMKRSAFRASNPRRKPQASFSNIPAVTKTVKISFRMCMYLYVHEDSCISITLHSRRGFLRSLRFHVSSTGSLDTRGLHLDLFFLYCIRCSQATFPSGVHLFRDSGTTKAC
jgi:hypothetical protein